MLEPRFRTQRGELVPCLAMQKCLVSKRCKLWWGSHPCMSLSHGVYPACLDRCQHPHGAPGAQGLVPRSCRLRCKLPVRGAPHSSAHRARPRLSRLVRTWFLTTGGPASAALPCFRTGSLLC